MSSLLTRAVLVSVHGHKQLSSAPINIHLRATEPQAEWQVAAAEALTKIPVIILSVLNIALVIPLILYVAYTLGLVLPTLAAVESSEATYEPIPTRDEKTDSKDEKSPLAAAPEAEEAGAIKRAPITASIRATQKHLRTVSSAGWRSLFRGLGLATVIHILSGFIVAPMMMLVPGLPAIVPMFLVDILLVQLNTAWVHSVISTSAQPWWHRLPPFGATLKATILPICGVVGSTAATSGLPTLVLLAMGRPMVEHEIGTSGLVVRTVEKQPGDYFLCFAIWFGMMIFAAYPALIVLTRVQASLLPDSEETIVPFDRSMGRTTPLRSSCQLMRDAYNSYSGSWGRFYKLVAKSFVTAVAIFVGFQTLVGVEYGLGLLL
ncbi:ubiquitin carrier protein [Apiospora saccharicola]|uniref:Ubiquitin carrier protein n=1 Tax=Apiospora saccharicola TaxID=335842 RepID=A0ABR1TJ10_9PEZI